ncbi:hypothetical protein D9758_012466 [Tetrapyrgos nigripes]|uniref:Enoyl reductase (ER) domain-containing protein n=1 Tax=Tetrapyrgos nigripes TaxID=182062 RepID=A0A8H5D0C5_9AGAR|nr:hypothetical protein D9758_012466 [Tetrapyrgos nigripes]
MAPVRNGKLIFNEIPSGYPEPGKTTIYDTQSVIDLETVQLDGGVLIKVLCLSADPFLRDKMRDPGIESFTPAYIIGEPTYGYGIGKVIRSEKEGFKAGDIVHTPVLGTFNLSSIHTTKHVDHSQKPEHVEYTVQKDFTDLEVIVPEPGLPLSVYLGAAGMPVESNSRPHRILCLEGVFQSQIGESTGETAFVTVAAGAVGSFVVQLAKLEGMKVITSAGSEDKLAFLKSLGADVAFNYKTTDTSEILVKEGPIDVYWDNAGGAILDAALGNAAVNARFIECGMISGYNSKEGALMKNLWNIVTRRISLNGFIAEDLNPKWKKEFFEVVPKKLVNGELKYREDITEGLEHAGEALLEVQLGRNTGKKIIIVAKE